jgi:hypothetical protein
MLRRFFGLLILLYVTLDLSSPAVEGAFNFDPDESVLGIVRMESPLRVDAAASDPMPALAQVAAAPVLRPLPLRSTPVAERRGPVARDCLVQAADRGAPSDDH